MKKTIKLRPDNYCYVGNNGYVIKKKEFSENEIKKIKKDLTMIPKVIPGYGNDNPDSFTIYGENANKLYLPKFYGFSHIGFPSKNKLQLGSEINITFNSSLRPIQEPIVEAYLNAIKDKDISGGIICAGCGVGKTIMAIYLASVLKKKTIILVHKEFLMNQWKERIQQFTPDAKIGIIQGPKYDIGNKDIVIGMIQSISNKDYPPFVFEDFGLLIADECHHLGAKTFCKSLKKISTAYTLGLSATPNRKDGLSNVFKYYLGDIVYKTQKEKDSNILVDIYQYYYKDASYGNQLLNYQNRPNNAGMINQIANCEKRNKFIIDLVKKHYLENRKILILTERLSQVAYLYENIEPLQYPVGKYCGGMKQVQLDKSLEKDILVGTYTMIEEGFDCPKLDTLIMATPKSSIEQSVGRILRKKPSERIIPPLIIDVVDMFSTYSNKGLVRRKYYKKNNYSVSLSDVKQVEDDVKIDIIFERKKEEVDEDNSDDEGTNYGKNKKKKQINYSF
tara:strand:- start:67 stop:1581 length:1515 start_codon:yes stop_codon:yes gene_type:complete